MCFGYLSLSLVFCEIDEVHSGLRKPPVYRPQQVKKCTEHFSIHRGRRAEEENKDDNDPYANPLEGIPPMCYTSNNPVPNVTFGVLRVIFVVT